MAIQKWRHTLVTVSVIHIYSYVSINRNKLDPREYCISTKDFVLTEEGKLKGLNTSA